MNKMKKLLSVLLAVIMALSCMSVMSSAAVTKYQSVDNLKALDAYSPYGQVTRLSTEERASMVQDFLDNTLAGLNINMGTLIDILGIKIVIDLTSVDQLCYSIDTIASLLNNDTLVGLAGWVIDLGVLAEIDFSTWESGMTREKNSQLDLFRELLEFLNKNASLLGNIVSTGTLDLGGLGGMIGDISGITDLLGNIPGLIKGLVLPLIERWDDTLEIVKKYDAAIATRDGGVEELINFRVKKLFTDDMSQTTVKFNDKGEMTSEHTKMPIVTTAPSTTTVQSAASTPRIVYHVTGTTEGSVMTVYHLVDKAEEKALAKDTIKDNEQAAYTYFKQENTLTLEEEVEGNGVYVWKEKDDKGEVVSTLKFYNDNSPLLPGAPTIDLSTMSAGELLYKFIPVVFEQMAPVVLNGSVKKILAEFFGAKFTYVGDVGSDAVNALPDASNAFFTNEKGDYIFNNQWSDYIVINGNHYWRFEDQIWAGDLSKKNNYFDIINWEYNIDKDFMDEFVDAADPAKPETRILLKVNDFLIKVAERITVKSILTEDSYVNPKTGEKFTAQWTRPDFATGNANLVANIKAAAQAVIGLAPQHIFGSDYATNERCYYELMMSSDNDTVLVGIAATLVDALMPSMSLPGKSDILTSGAKVGAILAAVIREFAAYLAPEYNFDALIYTSFDNGTKKFVTGKDSGYWFDVILTMGINVGFEYLRAFSDMGEGTAEWNSFVSYSGYGVDGKTYAAGTTQAALNAEWEGMLDYVVDWALDKDYEWTWKMENLVNTTGLTIDLTTAQDPFAKIQQILGAILPVDEILTVTPAEGESKFEHWLRQDLILGIVDLKWDHLINTIQFNGTNNYFRTNDVLDQLAKIIKGIVNSLFAKVGGGSYALLPSAMTDIDSLANQANLGALVEGLLTNLLTAYNNGLLDTALPIVNMFLGWHTDAQKLADPQVWETFRDNNDYAFQWVDNGVYPSIDADNTQIHFLNNSAGMLETHRNSSVVDKEYTIKITNITSDATVNTLTFDYGDGIASPYETIDIKIGGTYKGEEAATVTIAYEYTGKDGLPIGGTQYLSRTIFFSNQFEDNNVTEGESDKIDSGITWETRRAAYNKFIFSEDIYTAITEASVGFRYKNSISGNTPFSNYEAPDLSWSEDVQVGTDDCGDPIYETKWYPEDWPTIDQHAQTYFTYKTRDESGWPDKIESNLISGWGQANGKFYKSQYAADYDYPIGTYAFQPVSVTYDGEAVYKQIFIHYDDYDIYELYTENKNNGYNANQGVDAATYKAYNDAWKNVVRLATYPLMTKHNGNTAVDYVDVIMPQIQPAMEAFEAAKEAYEKALAEAQASSSAAAALPAYVEALRNEIDNDFIDGKEINFQDYNFYEYFNYNDVKVAGENIYRGYLAPKVMDKYYIQGSGISEAELNLVMNAEANEFIAAGIAASRLENKQEDIDASALAAQDWKQPVNTKLNIEDVTARMAFYKQFLKLNAEPLSYNGKAAHIYFLEKEIAFVEAQKLNSADYESVTWGRFADALAEAKAVAAGTDEFASYNSRIYDVKYNLMVAYKQLLAKADSLIEAGGTAILEANIETANAIFASLAAGDGAWTLKEGVDADKAYADLISALGYKYQARYTEEEAEELNDGTKEGDLKFNDDGSPMIFNLYADSALEYSENDRPNKQANQAKVDAANAKLDAAIKNFEAAAPAEPNTLVLNENAPFEAVIDLDNNIGGEYTGTVYGFDTTGLCNENWEADGAIADFLTTAYGDDYLEVIVPDSAGVETTGTVINVLDDEGNVVESYMFVLFGDADMDGLVGESDAAMSATYEIEYVGFDNLYQFMAGDLDNDLLPGESDAAVMATWEIEYFGMPFQVDVAAGVAGQIYEIY